MTAYTSCCFKLALIFATVLTLISTHTLATGDAAKGKIKAATCIGCHGANGNSMVPIFPKLLNDITAAATTKTFFPVENILCSLKF
jgi:cytochrome c553